MECDAVLHLRNGSYGLIEIKLGGEKNIEEGAKNLKRLTIIAKTKCAKIENETSKTSLFFASFFLLASGFVKCKLNAD